MSGDGRTAVAIGLRRLVEDGAWPAENLVTFQNLLLDQAGGDTRPLVGLLLRAVEQGVAEDLATVPVGEWEQRRSQFVSRLIANAFVQPEMARWSVHAWAYAFGREQAPIVQELPPPPPEPQVEGRDQDRWRPHPAASAWATPPQRPRSASAIPRPTFRAPSPGPLSARDIRRDRITFAVLGLAMMTSLLPVACAVLNRPDGAPVPSRPTIPVAAPVRRPIANGPFSGSYRVERTLESVTGDPSCSENTATVRWPVPSTEVLIHDTVSGMLQFATRPEVRGRISPQGDLVVGPVFGEKEGVRYSFRMIGRFSADGFEARAETSTRTVLGWLKLEECHLAGRLSGRRLE